jgi:hypothetical protein
MRNVKQIVSAAAVTVLASTWAQAQGPETDLEREIGQLQARVVELQSQEARDSAAVAATIDQVLRDAERRTQLLAAADSGAGYDNGFYIKTGAFVLKPGIQFQLRNNTDYRANTSGGKDDEIENGFEVRRLKLNFAGSAFTKDLTYDFVWIVEREGGDLLLEQAWVKYMFADLWGFRAGQFKSPGNPHEELVSSKRQVAVERTMANELLGGGLQDFVQAVTLIYGGYNDNSPVNVEIGLTDGVSSDNSDYVGHYPLGPISMGPTSSVGNHAFDFGVAGRAEFRAMGAWKAYQQLGAKDVKEDTLVIGAGFDWNQGGDGNLIFGNVDVSFQHTSGLALYGGVLIRHVDDDLSSGSDSFTDWGLVLQASYLINPAWEAFLRYGGVFFDDEIVLANDEHDDFHEITVGVTHFLGENGSAGHRAKVTVDLSWLPHGSPKSLSGNGFLGDSGGDDEIVLRGQFQLLL